jgi:hypothetical protein
VAGTCAATAARRQGLRSAGSPRRASTRRGRDAVVRPRASTPRPRSPSAHWGGETRRCRSAGAARGNPRRAAPDCRTSRIRRQRCRLSRVAGSSSRRRPTSSIRRRLGSGLSRYRLAITNRAGPLKQASGGQALRPNAAERGDSRERLPATNGLGRVTGAIHALPHFERAEDRAQIGERSRAVPTDMRSTTAAAPAPNIALVRSAPVRS